MCANNLQDIVDEHDDLVLMLRENANEFSLSQHFPAIPNEVTNWIDEQRAIVETCALGDLSYHMPAVHVEGPDAVQFFEDLAVNSFEDFEVGAAKHVVLCSPNGDLIGDGPLLRLDEDEFWGVPDRAENWIEYNLETGDYDVTAQVDPPSVLKGGDPETFIYQVQGPRALDVLSKLTDANLAAIPFYRFEEITLAGHTVRAFGHGMSLEPGFEFHGPWAAAAEVKRAILEAGEAYGIRHLGSKAYNSQSVRLGWLAAGPPPIYDVDEMAEYRRWLDADGREANFSIEGSFDADDVSEYYMDPIEYGFGKLVSFDHDFVGRDAIERRIEHQERTFVSLTWDDEDVIEVYASLFGEGDHYKHFELPRSRWANSAFDEVLKDGDLVGLSRRRAYQPDIRGVTSLGVVDVEYGEPGTEVTVVWGEGGNSPNQHVEDHVQTEITATVGPVPYTEDQRK